MSVVSTCGRTGHFKSQCPLFIQHEEEKRRARQMHRGQLQIESTTTIATTTEPESGRCEYGVHHSD